MTTKSDLQKHYAYALGYLDGMDKGTEDCPFASDELAHLYRQGYDCGVADYCRKNHPEDEKA